MTLRSAAPGTGPPNLNPLLVPTAERFPGAQRLRGPGEGE